MRRGQKRLEKEEEGEGRNMRGSTDMSWLSGEAEGGK